VIVLNGFFRRYGYSFSLSGLCNIISDFQFCRRQFNLHNFSYFPQLLFFCGGLYFFVKELFKNYEIKHISIQLIFSITFALSLTLFELIIFEIIGILESSSRFFHWRLSLVLILIMIIAVIPYQIAHSLISNIRIGKKNL
jgi:hypothetical protein